MYQQQVVQTFYVQNADAKELTDFLKTVADARFEGLIAGVHAISVRDTPERVAMIGRLIAAVDKARPEVVVDVEILEVDRTKLEEYGLQVASNTSAGQSPGLDGSVNVSPDPSSVAALQSLSPANVLVTGIPALYYRLLKTDTNTRTLANPHVRMTDGVQGVAEFGESVPGTDHDVRACSAGRADGTGGHVVHLQERRRQHHDDATDPRERRRLARARRGPERPAGHDGLPGTAGVHQPACHDDDPLEGRRDEHPGGADSEQRGTRTRRLPRVEQASRASATSSARRTRSAMRRTSS